MKTNDKGDIGVARVIADLIEQGWAVCVPVSSVSPFDLVVYKDGCFKRLQVKYCSVTEGIIRLDCRVQIVNSVHCLQRGNTEIDVACAYCPDTNQCYYVEVAGNVKEIRLRVEEKHKHKNSKYAKDYTRLS